MSSSVVKVTLVSKEPAAEVFLIDRTLKLVTRGLGKADAYVAPGIYRAKQWTANHEQTEMVEINESDAPSKTVELDSIGFRSPFPLAGTESTHEYHMSAIANLPLPKSLGTGANIVIFVRDPAEDYRSFQPLLYESYSENFKNFCLMSWDTGDEYRLNCVGTLQPDLGYLLVHLEINPGTYVLRYETGDGHLEHISLIAVQELSLHVFMNLEPGAGMDPQIIRPVRLSNAALVYEPRNRPFDNKSYVLRIQETVRHGMERRQNVIDKNTLAWLNESNNACENPLFALMAVHNMLLSRTNYSKDALLVLDKIAPVLGNDYPDVVILRWKLLNLEVESNKETILCQVRKLQTPPLFSLSWSYLCQMTSHSRREVIHSPLMDERYEVLSSSVWFAWSRHVASPEFDFVNSRSLRLATHLARKVLKRYDVDLKKALNLFGNAAEEIYSFIKKVNWPKLVRSLKEDTLLPIDERRYPHFTRTQKQLLVAIRDGYESLKESGKINAHFIDDVVASVNMPWPAAMSELDQLISDIKAIITADDIFVVKSENVPDDVPEKNESEPPSRTG